MLVSYDFEFVFVRDAMDNVTKWLLALIWIEYGSRLLSPDGSVLALHRVLSCSRPTVWYGLRKVLEGCSREFALDIPIIFLWCNYCTVTGFLHVNPYGAIIAP